MLNSAIERRELLPNHNQLKADLWDHRSITTNIMPAAQNTKEGSTYLQKKEFSTDYDSEDVSLLGPQPDRLENRNLHMTKSRSLSKNSSDGESNDLSCFSMSLLSNASRQQLKEKLQAN
ncbi:11475_t:CDS:2 [Paraglomus brasilianum]|uniref:11475_t:CDS:1 n=1 Tax=Paraglomus brasilianum TaxID=144538 RepID=A0A9N9GIZ6_9GLOM|nr:11475_t:CDS:2 [Paraglomus brasilianum]